jgi:hypothetical protein
MPSPPRITEVTWDAPHSTLRIRRPCAGVVVVVVTGTDIGEHGDAPMVELTKDVQAAPIELFIDARDSRGVTIDVSGEWARWLAAQREALRSIHMLTGSRFVQLTANFVRNFAALGERMRIYTDARAFDEELDARTAPPSISRR